MTSVPFSFSLVDNEVSDDLDQSLGFAVEHRMRGIELMSLWGTSFEDASQDLHLRAKKVLEHSGIEPTMVLSPAFKALRIDRDGPESIAAIPGWREHVDLLQAAMDVAIGIGCSRVRIFTCQLDTGGQNPSIRLPDGGQLPSERLEVIRSILLDAAQRAADSGLTLCVENVRSCFGNSGHNTAEILSAVDHPAVRAIWDPANAYVAGGDNFRTGYDAVKPWIVHVHAKDATVMNAAAGLTAWTAIGQGDIDWNGQIQALVADRYEGYVSLETHWHPEGRSRVQNSRESFYGLLDAATSRSASGNRLGLP